MSARERLANDALRTLDEMHRFRRIERDEYRRRRRDLLESFSDTTGCTGRDTVRRVVPATEPALINATSRQKDAGPRGASITRERRKGAWWIAAGVLVTGMVAGAAVVCWFVMTT